MSVKKQLPISVLLPVYRGDDAPAFREALQSLALQTAPAEEILVVADGPLSEVLEAVLKEAQEQNGALRLHRLPENRGLSGALNAGLAEARFPWVARMDADDICREDRLERQWGYLQDHPQLTVLGSWIAEFEQQPAEIRSIRRLPEKHADVLRYARWRCPFNHMTVLYHRDRVRAVGAYKDYGAVGDDYELWARLLMAGHQVANIPEPLVYARASSAFFGIRRRGLPYLRHEWREVRDLYRLGLLRVHHLLFHLVVKTIVRLAPPRLVRVFYWAIRKTS
jgi:glycosyltransferase involved in cell wall biosynthesis